MLKALQGGETSMKTEKDLSDFLELYSQVYQELYHFALYTLKNPQDAEDTVSDTVLAAFEQFEQLRSKKSFRSWIFKILANKCNRRMRSYYQKTVPLEQAENNLVHEPDFTRDAGIRSAFAQLKEEEQMIVALCVFGGYREREIASMLNQNYSTVRSKYHRALKKMRECILS